MNADRRAQGRIGSRVGAFAQRLLRGYVAVFRSLATGTAVILATIAIAIATVYPLWYAARHARTVYTAVVGLALLVIVAGAILRRLYGIARQARRSELPPGFFVRKLRGTAMAAFILLLGYSVAVLAYRGNLIIALPVGFVMIVAIGAFASRRNGTHADST